jgi:hypothetical protein
MRWPYILALTSLTSCVYHPVDCALGFYHDDCSHNSKVYKQALVENDDAMCRLYGMAVDTPEYVLCLQQMADQRVARPESSAPELLGAILPSAMTDKLWPSQ